MGTIGYTFYAEILFADAGKFKEAFEMYQNIQSEADTSTDSVATSEDTKEEDEITKKLDDLTVKEDKPAETSSTEGSKETSDKTESTEETATEDKKPSD